MTLLNIEESVIILFTEKVIDTNGTWTFERSDSTVEYFLQKVVDKISSSAILEAADNTLTLLCNASYGISLIASKAISEKDIARAAEKVNGAGRDMTPIIVLENVTLHITTIHKSVSLKAVLIVPNVSYSGFAFIDENNNAL